MLCNQQNSAKLEFMKQNWWDRQQTDIKWAVYELGGSKDNTM